MSADAILDRAIVPNRKVVICHNGHVYPTRVESTDGSEFTVSAPFEGPAPAPIRPGETVAVEIEVEHGVIRFGAPVRGRRVAGVPLLALEWPGEYERQQRREYVRVPARLPVMLLYSSRDDGITDEKHGTHTRDIGGGGLQVTVTVTHSLALSVGREVGVVLELADGQPPVRAIGYVARARELARNNGALAEVGIEFRALAETDRNRLCRFIYNRQIELRKKGLL